MKKLVIATLLAAGVVGASAQGSMFPISKTTSQITYGESYGALAGEFVKSTDGFTGAVFYNDTLITTVQFTPINHPVLGEIEAGLLNAGGSQVNSDLLPVGTEIDLVVGAYSDWNKATTTAQEAFDYVASVQGGYGVSDPFKYTTGNPTGTPPTPAESSMDFNSFAVEIVPEPTTIALGILGLGGLFLLRRRS